MTENLLTQEARLMAEELFKFKPDVVKRFFLNIPDNINVYDPARETFRVLKIASPARGKWHKDIYSAFKICRDAWGRNSDDVMALKNHIVTLLEKAIYKEVFIKKIPASLFEAGAMSYGFCDTISYYGPHFLGACEIMAEQNKLDRINWGAVRIKFYVQDLANLIKDQADKVDFTIENNCDKLTYLSSTMIQNWPKNEPHRVVLIDLSKNQTPILAGYAIHKAKDGYETEAVWHFDPQSIKFNKYNNNSPSNQYFKRPIAIAMTKTRKEFCKAFYGPAILGMHGLFDGDDEVQLKDANDYYTPPQENSAVQDKRDYASEKLKQIGLQCDDQEVPVETYETIEQILTEYPKSDAHVSQ